MSRLYLVRHAQASFLQADYDKLSPLGETQSRLLGEYWARHGVVFDRVGCGPRVRQNHTARIVADAYHEKGLPFPEPAVMDEFDEYQGEAVLAVALPQLVETNASVRELHRHFIAAPDSAARVRTFQKLFQSIITRWVAGELTVPGAESWPEFSARVNHGLSRFLAQGRRGEQTAIFCSGGPVSVAVGRALNLSAPDILRVAWMLRNSSHSEFLYSGERFTLSSLNAVPHIEDAAHVTYW
jgi:broad specificity phosphatase PhoE